MLTALSIALVAAPLSAIGAWLRRRDRLRLRLMTVVLAAVGFWLVLIGVALTGWRDLDGAIDCWPHCSNEQEAVKVVFWAAPLTALVFAFASVASLLRR